MLHSCVRIACSGVEAEAQEWVPYLVGSDAAQLEDVSEALLHQDVHHCAGVKEMFWRQGAGAREF